MKNTYLLISLILISISSHGQKVLEDSLTLEFYYDKGVPIIDKIWSAEDYVQCVEALEKIRKVSIYKLPRKSTSKSSLLFSKLTELKQYQFLNKEFYDFNTRFLSTAEVLQIIAKLTGLYLLDSPTKKGKLEFSNEISTLLISLLFLAEQEIELLTVYLKENPDLSEKQKNGLVRTKGGLNSMISGALETIEKDYLSYERSDIKTFSTYFFPFYKRVETFFDTDAQKEFNRRINIIAEEHKYEVVRSMAKGIK